MSCHLSSAILNDRLKKSMKQYLLQQLAPISSTSNTQPGIILQTNKSQSHEFSMLQLQITSYLNCEFIRLQTLYIFVFLIAQSVVKFLLEWRIIAQS